MLDLLKKLRILFDNFVKYNISINPTKSFPNYPDVRLLGQQVNFLIFITLDKKLKVIKHLIYPEILDALEYYLGLTGYQRSYIHFYAQLAALLQALKVFFFRDMTVSSQPHRAYASKIRLKPLISQEYMSF